MVQASSESLDASSSSVEDTTCSICLKNYPEENGTLDCCRHAFCAECIKTWAKLQNTCPLDRKIIKEIYVTTQAEGSGKQTISVEVIQYVEFIMSAFQGISKENRETYLRQILQILDGLQFTLVNRLHSENCITKFLDPDGNVVKEEMIKQHISKIKQEVLAKIESHCFQL